MAGPTNPYIAGKALGKDRGFHGRVDILQLVKTELSSPEQNAIVLFGQRRIGKSSILLQLQRRLPSPPFYTVYFDLMDQAHKPLGQVLHELAVTLAADLGIEVGSREQFDDQGRYFRRTFLPLMYKALGDERRPVLLLDEFDVLDVAAEEQLPANVAARAFFPYLRELMGGETRLGFVFVVGRKADDLSIDVKATFKAARHKRVSVLDPKSAHELITTAERQGTLRFAPGAVQNIMSLTAGHPYFTQLMCQLLWDGAYQAQPDGVPTVSIPDVDGIVPKVLEAGENVFEWIWDALPPAERVIFAAVAAATSERDTVSEAELVDILQRHGIRILTRELELAPATLVKWEMLREHQGGYGFLVEILRRWIVSRKPLPRVKDELDRIVPLADTLYQAAEAFYRQKDLEAAQDQLQRALRSNPNHLKARLRLGQVLEEEGKQSEALKVLEEAYRYDEDAARYPLVRLLLYWGEELERTEHASEAMTLYERVLVISPREKLAADRIKAIWAQGAESALAAGELVAAAGFYEKAGLAAKVAEVLALMRTQRVAAAEQELLAGNLDAALAAFTELDIPEKISAIKMRKHRAELETFAIEAQSSEAAEQWQQASKLYESLATQDPENERWSKALERVNIELGLSHTYSQGLGALEQGNLDQALRSLANVIYTRPDYKDAASAIARAIHGKQPEALKIIQLFALLFFCLSMTSALPRFIEAGWPTPFYTSSGYIEFDTMLFIFVGSSMVISVILGLITTIIIKIAPVGFRSVLNYAIIYFMAGSGVIISTIKNLKDIGFSRFIYVEAFFVTIIVFCLLNKYQHKSKIFLKETTTL